jgi:hypothetical protein
VLLSRFIVKTATTIVQILIRLTWLILLVLGIMLWTGGNRALVFVHQWLGGAFVLSLWALAYLGMRCDAGTELKSPGLSLAIAFWSLVVLALGLAQTQLLTGNSHWLIRVLHLLVGFVAIGLAEALGARIKRLL